MELNSRYKEYKDIRGDWFGQFPLGPDEPGQRHWIDEAEKSLGGDESDVLYYFNRWRYRGQIEPGPGVPASFGCSNAMGYGVQTPYAEIIEFANLGWSGFSNDAIARLVYTYSEEFNPSTVVVLWTIPQRREHVLESGIVDKFRNQVSPNSWQEHYAALQNDKLDEYNYIKNRLFVESYCKANNIQLIQFDFTDNDRLARDGVHPGPIWHLNMAESIFSKLRTTT